MKNKMSKKAIVLFICLFMVLFTVTASAATKNWTDTNNTHGTYPVEHEHVYGEWKVTTEPTCKEPGARTRECLFAKGDQHCDFTYTEALPANPDAHVKGAAAIVTEATCKTLGESEFECLVCGKTIRTYVEYKPHTYDENEWTIIEPIHDETKEVEGLKINTCLECGYTAEIKIPVEHVYEKEGSIVAKPTCVAKGEKLIRCTICNKNKIVPIDIDPKNHVYSGKALLVGDIDCVNGGKGIVTCEGCGKTDYVDIPASEAHDYLEWEYKAAEGDCKTGTNGIISKNCTTCGEEFEKKYWSGHVFGDDVKTHRPTCSEYGYQKGTCTLCGREGAEVILPAVANNHSWVEEVLIEPTCEKEGYVFRMCKYDSSHVEYTYIPKIGHTYFKDWTIVKVATCEEEGIRTNVCGVCGATVTETIAIDPNNHLVTEKDWDIYENNHPSCSKEGVEVAVCWSKTCLGKQIFRAVPKHTETLDEYLRVEATCKSEGEVVYDCYLCGEDVTEILPINPLAHRISRDYFEVKPATCHTEGVMSKICEYCRAPIETNYGEHAQYAIEKTTHKVGEWIIEVNATCKEAGLKYRKCVADGCSYVEKVEIPAGHRYQGWVVTKTATCKTAGERTRGCYYCDELWTEPYFETCKAGSWAFYRGSGNGKCDAGDTFRKSCITCGNMIEEKTLKSGEHINLIELPTEYKVSDTICTRKSSKCSYCQEVVSVTTNHVLFKSDNILKQEIAATCETPGQTQAYECKICKHYIDSKPIAAYGHNFEYDEEGTKYCLNCDLYYVKDGVKETCDHFCHNRGTIGKVLTKVLSFFWKILGKNHFCECGSVHYHQEETEILSKDYNKDGALEIIYSCEACKVKNKKVTL